MAEKPEVCGTFMVPKGMKKHKVRKGIQAIATLPFIPDVESEDIPALKTSVVDHLNKIERYITQGKTTKSIEMFLSLAPGFSAYLDKCGKDDQLAKDGWTRIKTIFNEIKTHLRGGSAIRYNLHECNVYAFMSTLYCIHDELREGFECDVRFMKYLMSVVNKRNYSYIGDLINMSFSRLRRVSETDRGDLYNRLMLITDSAMDCFKRKGLLLVGAVDYSLFIEQKVQQLTAQSKHREALDLGRLWLKSLRNHCPEDSFATTICLMTIASIHSKREKKDLAKRVAQKVVSRIEQFSPNFKAERMAFVMYCNALVFLKDARLLQLIEEDERGLNFLEENDHFKTNAFLLIMEDTHINYLKVIDIAHKMVSRLNTTATAGSSSVFVNCLQRITQFFEKLCSQGDHTAAFDYWEKMPTRLKVYRFKLANNDGMGQMEYPPVWQCYYHHVKYYPEAFEMVPPANTRPYVIHLNSADDKVFEDRVKKVELCLRLKEYNQALAHVKMIKDKNFHLLAVFYFDVAARIYKSALKIAKKLEMLSIPEENKRKLHLKKSYCLHKLGRHEEAYAEFLKIDDHSENLIHKIVLGYKLNRDLHQTKTDTDLTALAFFHDQTPNSYRKKFLGIINPISNEELRNSLMISQTIRDKLSL